MKKLIVSSLLILGFSNSSFVYALEDTRSTSVQFHFSVEILQKSCKISISPVDGANNVDMGKLFKKSGAVGSIVPLKFQFTKCAGPNAIESISYSKDMNGLGHLASTPYVSTLMDSKASSVRIYLYNDPSATIPFKPLQFGSSGHSITDEWLQVCYLQAKIPEGEPLPNVGDFFGQALFTITYL